MSPLPPLPPLRQLPKCAVCGKMPTRFVDTRAGRFNVCDTCEPPVGALSKLPPLTGAVLRTSSDLPVGANAIVKSLRPLSLPPLASVSAPKAYERGYVRVARNGALYTNCPPARVLSADCPWTFGDATPHKGAEDHYKCLTIEEICNFPLPPLADDAILFLWRVAGGNNKESLGEQAYRVARAWGFTPKSEMVWIKTLECKACAGRGWGPLQGVPEAMQAAFAEVRVWCDACKGRGYKNARGQGRYVRGSHEVCLIATRGKPLFPEDKAVSSVFNAHRTSHSEKPLRFFEKVQQLYPQGPYVELFARRRRPGWHCFGDQLPPE